MRNRPEVWDFLGRGRFCHHKKKFGGDGFRRFVLSVPMDYLPTGIAFIGIVERARRVFN